MYERWLATSGINAAAKFPRVVSVKSVAEFLRGLGRGLYHIRIVSCRYEAHPCTRITSKHIHSTVYTVPVSNRRTSRSVY